MRRGRDPVSRLDVPAYSLQYFLLPTIFHSPNKKISKQLGNGKLLSQLTKKIATETLRVTNYLLTPLMLMNARIVFIALMIMSLFFFDPMVAIVGFIFFGFALFQL